MCTDPIDNPTCLACAVHKGNFVRLTSSDACLASQPSRAPGFHQLGPEDLSPTSPTDLANFLLWMGLDYDTLQVQSTTLISASLGMS